MEVESFQDNIIIHMFVVISLSVIPVPVCLVGLWVYIFECKLFNESVATMMNLINKPCHLYKPSLAIDQNVDS